MTRSKIFQKKKREKRKQKTSGRPASRSAISPEGRRGAVMRMQGRADTTLAALLTRFELKTSSPDFYAFEIPNQNGYLSSQQKKGSKP